MRTVLSAIAVTTGIVLLAGCGRPTTAAEIDAIMATARKDAASDLVRARTARGEIPAWAIVPSPATPEDFQ